MLKLRRRQPEEHTEWLRLVPELLFVPIAVVVAPAAYSVYLLKQHHPALGVALMLAWGGAFAAGAWWLHRQRVCHIAVSAFAGIASVALSALLIGG